MQNPSVTAEQASRYSLLDLLPGRPEWNAELTLSIGYICTSMFAAI